MPETTRDDNFQNTHTDRHRQTHTHTHTHTHTYIYIYIYIMFKSILIPLATEQVLKTYVLNSYCTFSNTIQHTTTSQNIFHSYAHLLIGSSDFSTPDFELLLKTETTYYELTLRQTSSEAKNVTTVHSLHNII